jgi:hypothetical protein
MIHVTNLPLRVTSEEVSSIFQVPIAVILLYPCFQLEQTRVIGGRSSGEASQVDASGARILQDPAGNDVDSGQFRSFPTRIIEEPAGNIYGTWKQFSRRKFPVPDTAKFLSVPDTRKTTETIGSLRKTVGKTLFPTGNGWN